MFVFLKKKKKLRFLHEDLKLPNPVTLNCITEMMVSAGKVLWTPLKFFKIIFSSHFSLTSTSVASLCSWLPFSLAIAKLGDIKKKKALKVELEVITMIYIGLLGCSLFVLLYTVYLHKNKIFFCHYRLLIYSGGWLLLDTLIWYFDVSILFPALIERMTWMKNKQ